MTILIAKHLKKSYKKRPIVNDVSLSLKQGEIVGLLGPNGAGKTTIFYMILGLVRACSGEIWLNESELTHLSVDKRARKGLGYLPQEASVFRKLTVEENIYAILELRSDLKKTDKQKKLDELLESFQLTHLKKSIGQSLSGGERRRLEIARALAASPSFILLDEPFAGVDPISVIDIKAIINELCMQGIGVLITDHNVRETLDICHRAYIVGNGKVICEGSADVIINHKVVKKIYLGESFAL
jgi:lipopolysaccharide export system ATP-binding protein